MWICQKPKAATQFTMQSKRMSLGIYAGLKLLQALIVIAVLTAFFDAAAADTPPHSKPLDVIALDKFISNQVARHRIPGLAVAITGGDQIVFVRGYGQAQDRLPVTEKTPFRIASLSKSFTAMAVLQLVEAGHIELDAPIARYLPDFALATPLQAESITVRQLLNHTSGLADTGFVAGLNGQQKTLVDRVASLRAASTIDQVGTAFNYFDPNYQILARLVEVVSAQAFDAYLQQHIFTPLDMQDSISSVRSELPVWPGHVVAQGHIMIYGVAVARPELSGFLGGSGGVLTTAADMAHYLIAQGNHGNYSGRSVLSANSISLMQTPPAGVESVYAMGWAVADLNGTRTIEHNGVLSTFYADAVLLPESGYGLVLLYNAYALSAATLAFPEIKNGVVAILLGTTPRRGKLTMPWFGAGIAALSVLIIGLMIWRPRRLRSQSQDSNLSGWKRAWGWFWPIAPALLLLALPRLLALQTGRYFELHMLARAMPELIILLLVTAALGLIAFLVRLVNMTQERVRGGEVPSS